MILKTRKNPRASWIDYSAPADYHVTICTKDRQHYFGSIVNGEINLSQQGVIASIFIFELKNRYSSVEVKEFIVMPNHIHILLSMNGVNMFENKKPPNLSNIIGSYKSAVTKYCNKLGFDFGWHGRFNDSLIKSRRQYENTINYIRNNPLKWKEDEFFM